MKIGIVSDLHLEMHRDQGVSMASSIKSDTDILVLAGDIFSLKHHYWPIELMKIFCASFKDVIYTYGNHELYGTSPLKAFDNLAYLGRKFSNLHILQDGKPETIQSQRFIGGTLWFRDQPDNILYKDNLNDFHLIKSFVPWVYRENTLMIDNLVANLQKDDVLITHHLPSDLSVHEQYKNDSLNRFFVCDISDLISERAPRLCIHGHSHMPTDYMIGSTRIVSNPLGYPHEFPTRIANYKPLEIEI